MHFCFSYKPTPLSLWNLQETKGSVVGEQSAWRKQAPSGAGPQVGLVSENLVPRPRAHLGLRGLLATPTPRVGRSGARSGLWGPWGMPCRSGPGSSVGSSSSECAHLGVLPPGRPRPSPAGRKRSLSEPPCSRPGAHARPLLGRPRPSLCQGWPGPRGAPVGETGSSPVYRSEKAKKLPARGPRGRGEHAGTAAGKRLEERGRSGPSWVGASPRGRVSSAGSTRASPGQAALPGARRGPARPRGVQRSCPWRQRGAWT